MSPVKNRSAGFTLIELLVVVFIISLLVAITLTIIPKVKRAVYGAQTQAQLSALATAIQQYYNDYKSYPGPLPNSQLYTFADGSNAPFSNSASPPQLSGVNATSITGAQNLVLGLLGGLEMQGTGPFNFVYVPSDLFGPDGVTPAPKGPASLNPANPRRQQAYISVKPGDLSIPTSNGNSFADSAGRSPADAGIPVFLDKYSDPLPILYYRTNVGGTAIAGFRNSSSLNGPQLVDGNPAMGTSVLETAQYDILQNMPYVASSIGTIAKNPNSKHGLIGLGTQSNLSDPIDTNVGGTYTPSNGGSNAVAYFKDPALNPPYDPSNQNPPSNTHQGVARQKDGFLLISAGADRLYGTHDDQVFPGPLLP